MATPLTPARALALTVERAKQIEKATSALQAALALLADTDYNTTTLDNALVHAESACEAIGRGAMYAQELEDAE